MAKDLPYIWNDRTTWAIGAQPKVQNFNNPSTPAGGKAFPLIGGAIWPTADLAELLIGHDAALLPAGRAVVP